MPFEITVSDKSFTADETNTCVDLFVSFKTFNVLNLFPQIYIMKN